MGLVALPALVLATPAWADVTADVSTEVKAGVDAWDAAARAEKAGDSASAQRQFAQAVKDWEGPARGGDADAQFNLAQAYKFGRGVPQDLARSEALFGQAAAQGHLQAADNYGLLMFQRGDRARAMPYIRAAADRGEPRAQYLMGIALFNGENAPKDWVRAYAYESLAQQAGLVQAKQALAEMDRFIPLEQRQQSVPLASELAAQAESNRARQFASVDLGNPGFATSTAQPAAHATTGAGVAPTRAPVLASRPRPPVPSSASLAGLASAASSPTPQPAKPAHLPSGPWRIQIGAFAVASNVEAAWSKVKDIPGVAGHARLDLRTGRVIRLMGAGFSEEGAKAACARLTAAELPCVPLHD